MIWYIITRKLQHQLESYKEKAKTKPADKEQVVYCWCMVLCSPSEVHSRAREKLT